MKMTPEWWGETLAKLESWGFSVEHRHEQRSLNDRLVFRRIRSVVKRGEHEHLVLDRLEYPERATTYWLEIVDWHHLSTFPARLDSWRHRDDRVEFKFAIDPGTGEGVGFTVVQPS